ncbi:MAG: YfhO family protein, partial [Isosphaeraceae bacterium]|nr:YfhO family protein [Isosphaeraceae bacterium]
LGLGALGLALGRYSPLFPWYTRVPGLNLFRGPARYLAIVHLVLAALAAVAFADLAQGVDRSDRPCWRALWPLVVPPLTGWATGLGMGLMAAVWPGSAMAGQVARLRAIVIGPAWIALGAVAVALAARGSRAALVAIVALTAADQVVYGIGMIYRRDPPLSVAMLAASEPVPPRQPGTRFQGRWNKGALSGARLINGYVGLTPRRVLDYDRPASRRVAGVAWAREGPAEGRWRPVPGPLPRARLVTRAITSRDPRTDLERIDVGTTALTDRPVTLQGDQPGEATILEDRPGAIRIAARTGSRQLLVLAESYHEGWRAWIDGRAAPVLRVNGDFLGCTVEAGRHEVAWRFEPASYRLGARLTGLAVGLLVGSTGLALARASRRGGAGATAGRWSELT